MLRVSSYVCKFLRLLHELRLLCFFFPRRRCCIGMNLIELGLEMLMEGFPVWLQTCWQLRGFCCVFQDSSLARPGQAALAVRWHATEWRTKSEPWRTHAKVGKRKLPNFSSSSALPCTPGWSAKQKLTSAGVPCRHDT